MKKMKVLLADDNEDFTEILSEYINSQEDFKVVKVVCDGLEALRYLKRHVVDIVILDIIMPKLDGIEVLENAKSFKRGDSPKIIVLSALGQDNITQQAMEMGADYYFVKPFDYEVLINRIRQIMQNPPDRSFVSGNPAIDIDSKVSDVLRDFGFPLHVNGYDYVRKAIIMSFHDSTYLKGLTKRLYPDVASCFDEATPSRVERSIRNAINMAWTDNPVSKKTFKHTLRNYNLESKRPTNGKFIASVTERLKLIYSK
ncbi:MAG TPA: sporulation transcription factor Spo0A [Clostridia bacterium]|nr:sporulation transcription factor Spo0A [Clostridia bacterium]